MDPVQVKPKWRSGVGMAMIIAFITLWSVAVAALAPWMSTLPVAVQTIFYLVAGIAWIFPIRPLITWMGTGEWRRR